MKKLVILIQVAVLALFISNAEAQTKAERKMKTKGFDTDMYEGSESKEAMEYYTKGHGFTEKGDFKNAIKWYKKAIEADNKFVEAYDNMGVAYRKLGDLENAEAAYKKSIELYPQGNLAHQNLGIVYLIQKKYDKALEQYGIMQQNDSTDAEGYYGTIQIHMYLKDYKSAIKSATKTLEIYEATNSPYLSDAQFSLGLSYYFDGNKKAAKVYMEQAQKSGVAIPADIKKALEMN